MEKNAMVNDLEKFEKSQIEKLTSKKRIPAFRSGDAIKVTLKIIEGERSRLQAFEGVCIARKNNGLNSNFTVRKLSHGEGVERVFPLFSPLIEKIENVRKGEVRRSKIYYLRGRKGKRARIVDSNRGEEADQYSITENQETTNEKTNEEAKKTLDVKTTNVEKTVNKEESLVKEESSQKPVKEPVAEENISIEEKSESTASEADKTKDEPK